MKVDPVIEWDRPKLERFKQAYADAPGDKDAVFDFDGCRFLKSYAEYLIEYLEGRLLEIKLSERE